MHYHGLALGRREAPLLSQVAAAQVVMMLLLLVMGHRHPYFESLSLVKIASGREGERKLGCFGELLDEVERLGVR